jgi:hypothetical protein
MEAASCLGDQLSQLKAILFTPQCGKNQVGTHLIPLAVSFDRCQTKGTILPDLRPSLFLTLAIQIERRNYVLV